MDNPFKKFSADRDGLSFVIDEDLPGVGWYLYVYDNGSCVKDSLQDSLEDCMDLALTEFGVPIESWREIQS